MQITVVHITIAAETVAWALVTLGTNTSLIYDCTSSQHQLLLHNHLWVVPLQLVVEYKANFPFLFFWFFWKWMYWANNITKFNVLSNCGLICCKNITYMQMKSAGALAILKIIKFWNDRSREDDSVRETLKG